MQCLNYGLVPSWRSFFGRVIATGLMRLRTALKTHLFSLAEYNHSCNVMESTTVAEGHHPRLQQMRTSPNAAAMDAETKEETNGWRNKGRPQVCRYLQ